MDKSSIIKRIQEEQRRREQDAPPVEVLVNGEWYPHATIIDFDAHFVRVSADTSGRDEELSKSHEGYWEMFTIPVSQFVYRMPY